MLKSFSHIYIEEGIKNHPRTIQILENFKNSNKISIRHYKDVFNRKNQNFALQKSKPNLILAEKKDNFLYKGSDFSPNFSSEHFYYNTLALNCIYDCEYCYLQGMFSSANLVLFVNWEDFFSATEDFLNQNKSLYLALSYDTDLLALESFFPATNAWLSFAKNRPDLTLEIRTKSANFSAIQNIPALPNVVFAWTLSPESVIETIEHKTPKLSHRLRSLSLAQKNGWKVRVCLDPILRVPNWQIVYRDLADRIKEQLDPNLITEFSIGGFRMNSDFWKETIGKRKDSAILFYPFTKKDKIVTYSEKETNEILIFVRELFQNWIPESQIKVSFE